jgi:AcrR family transcriptional regulator
MTKADDLLTPKDVAKRLGLSPKTVYDHAGTKLPCTRIYTGQPRFHPLVIQALQEGASEQLAKEVAEAIKQGMDEEMIVELWRDPRPGKVIPLAPRRRRRTTKTPDDAA